MKLFIKKISSIVLLLLSLLLSNCDKDEMELLTLETVTNLKSEKISNKSQKLSWNTVANATKYVVNLAYDASFEYPVENYKATDITKNELIIDNLDPTKEYFFRVKAYANKGESEFSEVMSFYTKIIGVKTFTAKETTITSFIALWGTDKPEAEYTLEVSNKEDFSEITKTVTNITGTNTEVLIEELLEGTTYYYRVKENNDPVYSNISSANTLITVPTITVDATKNTSSSVILNWTKNDYAKNYIIEIAEDEFFGTIVKNEEVTSNTVTLNELKDGTLYYARVKTNINNNFSEFSETFKTHTTLKEFEITATADDFGFYGELTHNSNFRPNKIEIEIASDEAFNTIIKKKLATYDNGSSIINAHDFVKGSTMYYQSNALEPNTDYYVRAKISRFLEPVLEQYSKVIHIRTTSRVQKRIKKIKNDYFEAEITYKTANSFKIATVNLKRKEDTDFELFTFNYDASGELTDISGSSGTQNYGASKYIQIIFPKNNQNKNQYRLLTGSFSQWVYPYIFASENLYAVSDKKNYFVQYKPNFRNIEYLFHAETNRHHIRQPVVKYKNYNTTIVNTNYNGFDSKQFSMVYYLGFSKEEQLKEIPYFILMSKNIPTKEEVYDINTNEIENERTITYEKNTTNEITKITRTNKDGSIFEIIEF